MSKKGITRIGVPLIMGLSVAVAWMANVDDPLPATALKSAFILRIEHGAVAFAAMLFALVVLVRGLWDGELPTKIGREGAEYPVAAQAEKGLESLKELIKRRFAILRRATILQNERLNALEQQVKELEKGCRPTDDGT